MKTKLINCNLLTSGGRTLGQEVVIESDRIVHVGDAKSYSAPCREVDLKGTWLAPGFIDLQVNGAGGVLFQDCPDREALRTLASRLRKYGVTSFLPTLTATSSLKMITAVASVSDFISSSPRTILGINLEGPFIDPKKGGMANAQHIRPYYDEFLHQISGLRNGKVYMTFAPEVIDVGCLKRLAQSDIVLSIGHTSATYDQGMQVFDQGIRVATHLFNAMTGITGRDPGIAGAILDLDNIAASFIADGYHVHQANARLAFRAMGVDRLFLISDGMPSLGSDIKTFSYEGQTVSETGGRCTTEKGVLAGTGVDLAQACRNMATWLGVDVATLVPMITSTPARVLGVDRDLGNIAPGYIANFALTDIDFKVTATIIGGDLSEVVDDSM